MDGWVWEGVKEEHFCELGLGGHHHKQEYHPNLLEKYTNILAVLISFDATLATQAHKTILPCAIVRFFKSK